MTELSIDPGLARDHATAHDDVATQVHTLLNGLPTAVDGGIASATVADLIARVVTEAGAFADSNTVVAGVVREIAGAADATDQSAQEALQPLAAGLIDL